MKIAIIDDQEMIRYSVKKILNKNNHETFEYTGQEENLIQDIEEKQIEVLILDVMLEFEKTGIELLEELRAEDIKIAVILMTAFTTPQNVIKATQLDVIEILKKPFEEEELLSLVNDLSKELKKESDHELVESQGQFIGSFETMKNIYKKIGIASKNDLTVLINGDTGTGKELVASLIHQNSKRKDEPFVSINCASIPSELFESQLFGHEKGSFTGAEKLHIGYAQQVKNGTLFLDEIGELDIQLQSKILRFLENGSFRRIGGNEEFYFKGRILAATNINFQEAISNNTFREDLYFRLSMLNIELPSLNERKKDISLLADHFIHLANKDLQTSIHSISQDAINILEEFHWKGNIRQLRNTIYNAVLNAKKEKITSEDLEYLHLKKEAKDTKENFFEDNLKTLIDNKNLEELKSLKEDIDKKFLEFSIEKTSNISILSQALGLSRATLRKRLTDFKIDYKEK